MLAVLKYLHYVSESENEHIPHVAIIEKYF